MNKSLRNTLLMLVVVGFILIEWRPWQRPPEVTSLDLRENTPVTKDSAAVVKDALPQTAHPDRPDNLVGSKDSDYSPNTTQIIRAQLSPVNFTTMTAEISAKVETLGFREGESFNRGDTLVTFDCSVQLAQLERFKAVMGIAERNYNTNKKLLALGSVSRLETENTYSEFLKAKAEVSELSAIVSKCKVVAPFNGKVVEQRVRMQQFVQSGQPLLDILDSSALELEFVAPSKWSTWIRTGYQFKILIDEAGKSYPASVTRISPRIDPVSQTIKIAAVIDGNFPELTPGMSGSININPPDTQ